jgi:hypothetical protein
MDVAHISALSALACSVVGGMTSGVTTWLNQGWQTIHSRTSPTRFPTNSNDYPMSSPSSRFRKPAYDLNSRQ